MALHSWLSGVVPGHYAQRTSDAMREKLADILDDVQKAGPPDRAHPAIASLTEAVDALARAEAAIKASDHAGVAQTRDRLAATAANLRRVHDSKPPP